MITCKDLKALIEHAEDAGVDPPEFLGVLLMLARNYGRVAISKRLGIRERTVRRVVENYRTRSDVLEKVLAVQKATLSATGLHCTPVLYAGLSEDLLQKTRSAVVNLRDRIVIFSRDPNKVEVIGISTSGRVEYPGVPPEIVAPYQAVNLPDQSGELQRGVVVCWKNYRNELDDAVLLVGLGSLCEPG